MERKVSKMSYWDSMDCQVQCEEVYPTVPGLFTDPEDESEDIMDVFPVISLDAVRHTNVCGSYRMEDGLIESDIWEELWDSREMYEVCTEVGFRLGRVYGYDD